MQQRRLGRTGLKVSEICLGTMTFAGQCDEATSFRIMDVAAERGVTFFDTADVYPIPPDIVTAGRTEEVIGRWLSAAPGRRDRLVLATKCRMKVGPGANDQGLSRRHILAACLSSSGVPSHDDPPRCARPSARFADNSGLTPTAQPPT